MGTENISEVSALALASPSCQQVSQILIFHQNDTTMSQCHLLNFLVNSSSHSNFIVFTCVAVPKDLAKIVFSSSSLGRTSVHLGQQQTVFCCTLLLAIRCHFSPADMYQRISFSNIKAWKWRVIMATQSTWVFQRGAGCLGRWTMKPSLRGPPQGPPS